MTMSLKRSFLPLLMAVSIAAQSARLPAAPLKVNPNFAIENAGTPLAALRLMASTLYKHPDTGKLHLFSEFGNSNGYGIGEEEWEDTGHRLVDVELESGTMRRAVAGRPGGQDASHYLHPDGKLYLFDGKAKPASMASYDTRTGRYEQIGTLAGSAIRVLLGPSGKIYIGQLGGGVSVYDPASRSFLQYIKPAGRALGFVYTMQVQEPYIYCGMADRGNWFLTVIDTRTGKSANYFDQVSGQQPSKQGGRNDITRTPAGDLVYGVYPIIDGKPSMDAQGNPVPLPQTAKTSDPSAATRRFENMWRVAGYGGRDLTTHELSQAGITIDLEDAEPNNWNNGISTIRWRATDAKDWRRIEIKGLELIPYSLKVLGIAPDGLMYGVGNLYGAVCRFDPKTGKSEKLGDTPGSCYSILALKDATYFCGYVAFMAEYDHSKPYTTHGDPASRNPKEYSTGQKWTKQMLQGPDGRIYLGGKDGRHHSGGGFAIFNPKTKEMKKYPFELLGVTDMTFLSDKKTLVIVTTPVLLGKPGPEKGSVFLFDITQDKIVKETVLDLNRAPDEVLVAGGTTVLGVSRVTESDEYGRTTHSISVAGLDLMNGWVTFEKRHRGRAFTGISGYDRTPLVLGPDGCGWLFVDDWLCRLLPDGDLEKIRKMPEYRGTVLFKDKTAYIHNSGRIYSNRFANVVRIPNLFAE